MLFDTVAIVGVGLIGGSIGQAIKERRVARHIIGIGRNFTSLQQAIARQAIDEARLDFAAVAEADLVVVCSPVDMIARHILDAARAVRPGTIITDAGSTKASIVHAVEENLPNGTRFLGSHPLAGSEKQGVEHARGDLFIEKVCVLTPTTRSHPAVQQRLTEFWQALGMTVRVMSPTDHDAALATTSHLPHFVASLLANQLPAHWYDVAASGFRDTTRLAGGDPALWLAIALENAPNIEHAFTQFADHVEVFRRALANRDRETLLHLLSSAKKVHDDLGN